MKSISACTRSRWKSTPLDLRGATSYAPPVEYADRVIRHDGGQAAPDNPEYSGPFSGLELSETGAVWELLSFHKRLRDAIDELQRTLEPVLRPDATVEAVSTIPVREGSPVRRELAAAEETLARLHDLRARIDL